MVRRNVDRDLFVRTINLNPSFSLFLSPFPYFSTRLRSVEHEELGKCNKHLHLGLHNSRRARGRSQSVDRDSRSRIPRLAQQSCGREDGRARRFRFPFNKAVDPASSPFCIQQAYVDKRLNYRREIIDKLAFCIIYEQ